MPTGVSSQTQLAELLDKLRTRHPGLAVILLDHRREIRIPLPPEVVINPFNTLHHAMALIAQAELIISPDTSVVHMAAAWNKPLIAVYKDVLLNNRLWAPGYDNARQIIVKCGKYPSASRAGGSDNGGATGDAVRAMRGGW